MDTSRYSLGGAQGLTQADLHHLVSLSGLNLTPGVLNQIVKLVELGLPPLSIAQAVSALVKSLESARGKATRGP